MPLQKLRNACVEGAKSKTGSNQERSDWCVTGLLLTSVARGMQAFGGAEWEGALLDVFPRGLGTFEQKSAGAIRFESKEK